MTNNKTIGSEIERRARAMLKAEGAIDVQRAPSSLGPFDLWAIFPDHLKLISVKETKFMLTFNVEKERIKAIQVPEFCKKVLMIWYSYRPKRINKIKSNMKGWVIYNLN